MDSMNAIRIHAYGGPEQLRYEKAPIPAPGAGEILVRLYATSVNPWDYKLASGAFRDFVPLTFPYIPGGEYCGVVEAIGEGVTHLGPGDEVFGNCPLGAYAQWLAAPAQSAAPKPKSIAPIDAASVPVAGQTAWQALFDHGQLQPGQTVLIHAAAGGVGTFAVQLAHWKGARVLATASQANADYLRTLGADQVIDYKSERFETIAKNIDLVVDLIGGETQTRSFAVLERGGALVATAQPPSQEEAARAKVRAVMMSMNASTAGLTQLAELIDQGKLKTAVTQTYALSQAAKAWTYGKSGHTRGKVALRIEP